MSEMKIELMQDNTYRVIKEIYDKNAYAYSSSGWNEEKGEWITHVLFQGSICECESYIRLKDKGYLQ
jgi:hypothetical protein